MIKSIKNMFLSKKAGMVAVFSISAIFALVLVMAPRAKNLTEAFWDCNNAPTEATFNPYQPTEGNTAGTGCHDFPVIAIRNVNGQQGAFSNNISANSGDELYVRVWVHNGASDTLDRAQTIAHNVSGQISVSGGNISTSFSGSTASGSAMGGNNSGQVSVNLPSGAHLEVVDGSGEIYGGGSVNTSQSGASFNIGDQDACFGFARQIYIKVKVVGDAVVQSNLNLNLDKSDYCVGEYATYTVNGSSNLAGQSIVWSSTLNGNSTGENNTYAGHILDSNGHFTQRASSPWENSHIGSWTKTATVNGVPSTANFTVRSCATAQPSVLSFNVNPPTCTSNNAQISWSTQNFDNIEVKVNGTVLSGNDSGTESVNWLVPGNTYAFTFWNNGTLEHTENYPVPPLSCGGGAEPVLSCRLSNSNPSTLFVADSAQFVATGGNNQFSWSSEGNPNSGNGTLYETAFATAGSKAVTVQSGSQTATCYANIVARTQAANLTCTPGNVTLDINQSQSFTAAGGEGTEIWTVDDVTVFQAFASINRSFSTSGQHYVTVRKGTQQATCNVFVRTPVTPNPNPNPVLTCPAGSVSLSPSILNQGETSTASAPFGWYGGRFVSSNTNLVTISGNSVLAGYSSIGSSTVTGEGWTASNGATNCSLGWSAITVQRPQATNACVQRTFNTNSGVYANGGKASTLKANETFQVACDYGVVSGYITLDGNGAQGCNFSGWDHTGAIFDCKAPSAAGTYNVSCRISNNAQADNSCSSLNPVGSYSVTVPVQNALTCGPTPQNVQTGQTVSFAANGGNGTFAWTAVGGSQQTGSNQNFSTTFSQAGVYNVYVNDTANHQAICAVTVTAPVINPVCPSGYFVTVSPSNINVGQNAFVTVPSGWTGGSFTSSNSSIAGVNGSTITGNSAGTAYISGTGFSVQTQNGLATSCSLGSAPITVAQPTPNLACQTLTPSVNTNQTASFSATGGNGSYSWTNGGNPSNGSGSNFSTTFSNAGSKFVTVTSGNQTVNCPVVNVTQPPVSQVTCEITSGSSLVDINQVVSFRASGGNGVYAFNASTGNPATQGSSFNTSFSTQYSTSGSKNVTVISDGQIANCPIITVKEPQVPTLSCSAINSPVNVGSTASFSATGGNGSYSWTNGGSPSLGNGQNFSTVYSSAGSKTVTVQSGNQTANCSTQVIDIVVPEVVCNPGNQTANLNQTVYFSATGGNGNFNWSAPGSTNGGTTNSSAFNTAYQTSGDKTVTVSSSGKSGICRVNVLPSVPQTLTCSPNYQTVSIGEAAHFNAIGGTAPYAWQALDSTNTSGSGSSFSTSYAAAFGGQTKTVRLTSNDGQVANCQVTINPPTPTPTPTPTPVNTGNCNNSSASCNNNTNTNTSTNNNSTNSSNQNNNSNINGNNNTVTQSNQNCVNNSCNNTVYYIQGGNTVSQNDYRQLSIQKMVRNVNSGGNQNFQDSVSANNNDTVEFQIIVRNVGNQPVSNVQLTDNLPSGLSYISGQLSGSMNLGTLLANDSKTITFQARVNSNYTYNNNSNQSIQNIAMVRGDSVSQVQDDAWVFVTATTGCTYNCGTVQGSTVNLSYSKKAINETKATYAGQQLDATSVNATREDYITYTLTVTNSGNAAANSFVITDDLSQVLPYADMVDNGGGSLNGNVINFPGITVPAGGSVSKSFKVRVKYSLASNLRYTMTNVYGNTVTIHINNPQVLGAFVAPKTGADTVGVSFAMLLTLGFVGFKKRELISKLVLNN